MLAASMPHGSAVEPTTRKAGWIRTGDAEYEIELDSWRDAREPVGTAMLAAFAPILEAWSNELASAERASAYDQAKRDELASAVDA
jgi:hypothetical protein